MQVVSMECARCQPPWYANDVQFQRLPWSGAPIDTGSERYRCPGCGGKVGTTDLSRQAGSQGGPPRRTEYQAPVEQRADHAPADGHGRAVLSGAVLLGRLSPA